MRRWSIRLKNALSLAKSPLPAFIVRVGLDDADRYGFRAIHVWGDEIARILKAARKAHVEDDEATNRRRVSFEFGVETERADLLGWMKGEIDAIGEPRYATAKQRLVDTLGFEEGHGIARFRFSGASPDALADLQMGLLDGIDLNHFSFTPSRFGIEASRAEVELEVGRLVMTPNGRDATLRMRLPDGRQELVSARMFSAALSDGRRIKTRIKAGFIELSFSGKGRFGVRSVEDRAERTTLEHIGALALLRQSSRATPLTLALRTDRSFTDLGRVNMRKGGEPGWEELFHITETLRKITALEGAEPIVTSIYSINEQFVPLAVLDALVSSRAMRIEFTPEEETEGAIGTFLAYATIRLDDVEIGAVASRPIVADQMIGARRRIDLGPATVLRSCITDGPILNMRDLYLDELDWTWTCPA